MSRSGRAAAVRFYFDADILGLGKLMAGLRLDCTYPGDPGAAMHRKSRPACAITSTATLDEDWIPEVTKQGLLIITRDAAISRRAWQRQIVMDNGARMVALTGPDALNTLTQLESLMCQWRGIEALASATGPFIYTATRTTLKPIRP